MLPFILGQSNWHRLTMNPRAHIFETARDSGKRNPRLFDRRHTLGLPIDSALGARPIPQWWRDVAAKIITVGRCSACAKCTDPVSTLTTSAAGLIAEPSSRIDIAGSAIAPGARGNVLRIVMFGR